MLQPVFRDDGINQKLGLHRLIRIQNRRQQSIRRPILQRRQIGTDFLADILQPMTRRTPFFKDQLSCSRLLVF